LKLGRRPQALSRIPGTKRAQRPSAENS